MSQEVNPTVAKAEDIFKALVWDNNIEAALIAFHALPGNMWTNIFPIKQIIDAVCRSFSDQVYSVVRMVVDIASINILNSVHKSAYDKAQFNLVVVSKQFGVNSNEYKTARDAEKLAMSRFTRINQ